MAARTADSKKDGNHFNSERLLAAVHSNDLSAVKTAVARRRAEGRWDPRHWTVTMALIQAPGSEVATYLKDQGATVTSKCLPSAVQQGRASLLDVLVTCLKKNACWDPDDWYVAWALVEACCASNPEVRKALEKHGAQLTSKCLPLVVRNMVLACLRLIVTELKALDRWDPVDKYVSLALIETQRLHKKSMYVYLINQGARPTTQCLLVAVRSSNLELLRDVIYYSKLYRKWSPRDKFVAWALEEACLVPYKNMYEILVSEGGVPTCQCLLSAVRSENIALARRVVSDIKSKGTWTEFDWRLESARDRAKQLTNSGEWLKLLSGDVTPSDGPSSFNPKSTPLPVQAGQKDYLKEVEQTSLTTNKNRPEVPMGKIAVAKSEEMKSLPDSISHNGTKFSNKRSFSPESKPSAMSPATVKIQFSDDEAFSSPPTLHVTTERKLHTDNSEMDNGLPNQNTCSLRNLPFIKQLPDVEPKQCPKKKTNTLHVKFLDQEMNDSPRSEKRGLNDRVENGDVNNEGNTKSSYVKNRPVKQYSRRDRRSVSPADTRLFRLGNMSSTIRNKENARKDPINPASDSVPQRTERQLNPKTLPCLAEVSIGVKDFQEERGLPYVKDSGIDSSLLELDLNRSLDDLELSFRAARQGLSWEPEQRTSTPRALSGNRSLSTPRSSSEGRPTPPLFHSSDDRIISSLRSSKDIALTSTLRASSDNRSTSTPRSSTENPLISSLGSSLEVPLTSTPYIASEIESTPQELVMDGDPCLPGLYELRRIFQSALADKKRRDSSRAYHEAENILQDIYTQTGDDPRSTSSRLNTVDEEMSSEQKKVKQSFQSPVNSQQRNMSTNGKETEDLPMTDPGESRSVTEVESSAKYGGRYKPSGPARKTKSTSPEILRPTPSADIALPVATRGGNRPSMEAQPFSRFVTSPIGVSASNQEGTIQFDVSCNKSRDFRPGYTFTDVYQRRRAETRLRLNHINNVLLSSYRRF